MEQVNLLIASAIVAIGLLGYFMQRSKVVFIVETMLLIAMIGGYCGDIDLNFYRNYYNLEVINEDITERLYSMISIPFHRMGMTFEQYHVLLAVLSIGLIAYVVYKMSNRPAFCMSCLVGFSTIEYGIQIKAMCAAAITVYAIYFLFYASEKMLLSKRIFWYCIIIVIACGFHFVSAFFFVMPFALIKHFDKLKKWIVIGSVALTFSIPVLGNLALAFNSGLITYIGKYRAPHVLVGMVLWQVSGMFIVALLYRQIKRGGSNRVQIAQLIYNGTWLMVAMMPFYTLTTVAIRMVRTWSVFYFILASYAPEEKGKLSTYKTLMILYGIGSFVLHYIVLQPELLALKEILNHNIFWGA